MTGKQKTHLKIMLVQVRTSLYGYHNCNAQTIAHISPQPQSSPVGRSSLHDPLMLNGENHWPMTRTFPGDGGMTAT